MKILILIGCIVGTSFAEHPSYVDDPQVLSIAFVGCNRVGWSGKHHPSTANVAQLMATFEDIATMDPPPEYFFFCGDLVRNESTDEGQTLENQLEPWFKLFASSEMYSSATTLVPITGNHETLQSYQASDGTWLEKPNPATYPIWVLWLEEHGLAAFAGNGPPIGGEDLLTTDGSKLTYSFDSEDTGNGKIHFIVIDTDALSSAVPTDQSCLQQEGVVPVPGWIAINWLEQDIAAATNDPSIQYIFALGHKPMESFNSTDPTGRESIIDCDEFPFSTRLRTAFQASTKFKGYLTSHVHLHQTDNLADSSDTATWQIIAGNGGSQLDDRWEPMNAIGANTPPFYGYSVVRIHESGKVFSDSYGRSVPDPYDADVLSPAQRLTSLRNTLFIGVPCAGDVNEDGVVSVNDLLYIIRFFGDTSGAGDLNDDGVTNIDDLLLVVDSFESECE